MVLHKKSSKTDLGFTKFVQESYKNNSGQHKHKCLTVCQGLLNHCHNEGDAFFKCTVAGNEMWIHHYAPESTHQIVEWKNLTACQKKFKIQPSAGKAVL
jgi:hypothetical protein